MRVSSINEDVSIAVVGGKESTAAGLSNDATFMLNLADGLYSNKPLACAQEVLCNAWDIHIKSGNTDKHVEITYDDMTITFKDYGPGIPFDIVEDVYLVYGKSTKVESEDETGGFGLGSKSPWAVTDQFTMTNCHDGVAVTYTLVKSDPSQHGKPSMRELFRMPTEETGVTVTIPLQSSSLGERMVNYAKVIAYWADIKLKVNGIEMGRAGIDKNVTDQRWFMATSCPHTVGDGSRTDHKIIVRIGSVLYPVPLHDRYANMYSQISGILSMLGGDFTLVLLAKSGTVMMTPSRESLSMTEVSVEGLHDLLLEFCETFTESLEKNAYRLTNKFLWNAAQEGKIGHFLPVNSNTIPLVGTVIAEEETKSLGYIVGPEHLVAMALQYQTPSLPDFASWLERRKLDIIRSHPNFKNHGLDKKYVKRAIKARLAPFYTEHWSRDDKQKYQIYVDLFLKNFRKKLKKYPDLEMKDIGVTDGTEDRYYYGDDLDVTYDFRFRRNVNNLKAFVRKEVIIASSATRLRPRFKDMPVYDKGHPFHVKSSNRYGDRLAAGSQHIAGILFINTRRSKKRRDAAIKLFTELGYKIYDATERMAWEPEPTPKDIAEAEETVKRTALQTTLPKWSEMSGYNNRKNKKRYQRTDNTPTVEMPKQIVALSYYGVAQGLFTHLTYHHREYVKTLLGSTTGCVFDTAELKKYTKRKRMIFKTVMQVILEEMYEVFSTSLAVRNSFHYYVDHRCTVVNHNHYRNNVVYDLVKDDPILCKNLSIKPERLTERERILLQMWAELSDSGWATSRSVEEQEKTLMDKIFTLTCLFPGRQAAQDERERLNSLPLMGIIDTEGVVLALNNNDLTYTQKSRIKLIINQMLKG